MGNSQCPAVKQWNGDLVPRSRYADAIEDELLVGHGFSTARDEENTKVHLATEYSKANIKLIREALENYEDLMDYKMKLDQEEFELVFGLFLGDSVPHFDLFTTSYQVTDTNQSLEESSHDINAQTNNENIDIDPFEVICAATAICGGTRKEKLKVLFRAFNQRSKEELEISTDGLLHIFSKVCLGCWKLLDMEIPSRSVLQESMNELIEWIEAKNDTSKQGNKVHPNKKLNSVQLRVLELHEVLGWIEETKALEPFFDRVEKQLTEWVPNNLNFSQLFLNGNLFMNSDSSSQSSASCGSQLSEELHSDDSNDVPTGSESRSKPRKKKKVKYRPIKHPFALQCVRELANKSWWDPIPVLQGEESWEGILSSLDCGSHWYFQVEDTLRAATLDQENKQWVCLDWKLLIHSWISSIPASPQTPKKTTRTKRKKGKSQTLGLLQSPSVASVSSMASRSSKMSQIHLDYDDSMSVVSSSSSRKLRTKRRGRKGGKQESNSSNMLQIPTFKLCSLLTSQVESLCRQLLLAQYKESNESQHLSWKLVSIFTDQSILSVIEVLSRPSVERCHVFQSPLKYLKAATSPDSQLECCRGVAPITSIDRLQLLRYLTQDTSLLGKLASTTLEWINFPLMRVSCILPETNLLIALKKMSNENLVSVPVINDQGKLTDVLTMEQLQYSLSYVLSTMLKDRESKNMVVDEFKLTMEAIERQWLQLNIGKVLSLVRKVKPCTTTIETRIVDVVFRMVETNSERCFIINKKKQVVGVIMASDILSIIYCTTTRNTNSHRQELPRDLFVH